ncbi:hypothetical protein J1614_008425 [Plenodomus biglobosus]|nr:hypothetical protein J1614_008425 [Plenodomus biglobosus]
MAPSPSKTNPTTTTTPPTNTDTAIDAHSSSALTSARRNLTYLYDPSSRNPAHPSSRTTRTLLRILRSSLIFAFWRIVRYAKHMV